MNTDTIDKWLQKLPPEKPWIENNSNKVKASNIRKTATDPSIHSANLCFLMELNILIIKKHNKNSPPNGNYQDDLKHRFISITFKNALFSAWEVGKMGQYWSQDTAW